MPDPLDAELTTYAAGRWPVVVRTLVLLGAPPAHAEALATVAVARLLERASAEEWLDLDTALAAETVEAWEDDRTAWWHDPATAGPGLADVEAVLDALAPDERARLVLVTTAGLAPEQLDDVLGPGRPSTTGAAWRAQLSHVGAAVPVGEPRLREARAHHTDRRRRGRGLAVVGGLAGLALAAGALVVGVRAVDPQPGPVEPMPTRPPVERQDRGPDLLPVAWYDGRRVHLADRIVTVPGLRTLARHGDGVVAVDRTGQVLLVRGVGGVERLGATARGASAVTDVRGTTAAWVDGATGQLAVVRSGGEVSVAALPPRARVLALDRGQVFVAAPSGARRVRLDRLDSTRALPGLLDAASGTQVRRVDDDTVAVEVGPGPGVELPGRDGWLSDDGRYLLTRDVASGAAPPRVVVDLADRTSVRLPLPASSVVVDGAFTTGDDRVTFVLARANGTEYPADWPREGDYDPGFDLVVCDLGELSCQRDAMLFDTDVVPVLAR